MTQPALSFAMLLVGGGAVSMNTASLILARRGLILTLRICIARFIASRRTRYSSDTKAV